MENKEKKTNWSVTELLSERKVEFQPIWQEKDEQNVDGLENPTDVTKEMECAFVEVTVKDEEGKETKLKFNYLDLYGFIYFIGNEELRRQLALRYERKIVYMPYEVTFRIDEEEKKKSLATRRIELPIDEVAMAMVRAKAQILSGKSPVESEKELEFWREHQISNLPDQIKETYDATLKGFAEEKPPEKEKEIELLN